MSMDMNQILAEIATRTFEQLAFMMPADDGQAISAGPQLYANIAFDGPFSGRIVLAMSEDMLSDLAANMLGLQPPQQPSREQQQDAMKELLNVVCGNLLPTLAGKEAVFDVGAPCLVETPQSGPGKPVAQTSIDVELNRVSLALHIDSQTSAVEGAPEHPEA